MAPDRAESAPKPEDRDDFTLEQRGQKVKLVFKPKALSSTNRGKHSLDNVPDKSREVE